jgi:hypothetical protein
MTSHSVVEKPAFLQDLETSHFQVVCRQAAAIMDRPEYGDRLTTKAMDLVLSGCVTLHEDGTATVKSGTHTYEIAPDCTCEDARRRTPRHCKHYLAVKLIKASYERLYQPVNGHSNGNAPAQLQAEIPQSSGWECAQAPSSCTLKWNVAGIELMLTLRAADDQQLFNRISKVLPKIEAKVETQRQARQEQTPEQQHAEGYCAIHDVMMKASRDGKGFYHKSGQKPDGKALWCRGSK